MLDNSELLHLTGVFQHLLDLSIRANMLDERDTK
jgi:hypothetical protein